MRRFSAILEHFAHPLRLALPQPVAVGITGALFLGVLSVSAAAQTCSAFPYTLTNGTSADASQVMANFNEVRNCANGLASGGTLTDTTLAGGTEFTGDVAIVKEAVTTLNQTQLLLDQYGNPNDEQPIMRFRQALGTISSPQAVTDGTPLGAFQWAGYNGAAFTIRRADIFGIATEDWTTTANGTAFVFRTTPNGSTDPVVRMRVDQDGGVGINTETPAFKLHVEGTAGKPGGGSWSDSSDIRLKKNITDLTGALEALTQLRGVTYEWRNPDEHQEGTRAGFIAQEVEKVFPEWIGESKAWGEDQALAGDNGNIKILTFPHDFNAYLIEAIKELKSRNDALRRELADIIAANRRQAASLAELQGEFGVIRAKIEGASHREASASIGGNIVD
jgi:hypothetical protein